MKNRVGRGEKPSESECSVSAPGHINSVYGRGLRYFDMDGCRLLSKVLTHKRRDRKDPK